MVELMCVLYISIILSNEFLEACLDVDSKN